MEDRCLLSAYTLTDLGTLDGAPNIQVTGLNNLGQVVGYATETSGQYVGFLWSNGQMTSLGSVGSNDSGSINGINDSTQVVGEVGRSLPLERRHPDLPRRTLHTPSPSTTLARLPE